MQLTQQQILILKGKICPYCKQQTVYVDSKEIYGRSFGMIYLCRPCDAYCGVHKGTNDALGRLANKELREWKKKAHLAFDDIWKNCGYTRSEAYKLLSQWLELPPEYTHIGMFSVETCKKVVDCCKGALY